MADNTPTVVSHHGASGGSATASSRTNRNGDGGGGGNAPLLFEHLGEVSSLENGERREIVDKLGEIGHV